jgi:diguanylate cyclase (GGDEF)-like protein/PAS domain S-box-containing protein
MNNSILIVEDERIIALDLQRRLEKFGFHVCGLVPSGREAIDSAGEMAPDVILMDIMLSGDIDGIEAAVQIRKLYQIPVIFLTAYADENTLQRAKEAEPFGYILKPFKERELYTTINITLYKSRVDQELLRQEQLFSAILKSVGDGIIAVDENNIVQFMNPVAETLTGWKEEQSRDRNINDVFSLVDGASRADVPLPNSSEEQQHFAPLILENLLLKNKQGAFVPIEGSIADIHTNGNGTHGQVIAFRDITDIKKLSDTITYQASHDSLTGLLNRTEFSAKLEAAVEEAQTEEAVHSFVYIDLDQFKIVNDVCGHIAGDELLRQVTATLKDSIERRAVFSRLGGDEFGLLLLSTSMDEAIRISNDLMKSLTMKFIWQKNAFNISASMGIVPVSGVISDVYTLLAAADDACYLAKEEGGGKIKVYETADYKFLKRRGEMQWISRLTRALEEDRFCLYCQPIVSLKDPNERKIEILLRLREEDGNLVGPFDFIPAAERYNLMPAIDRWVIRETMESCRKLYEEQKRKEVFCINISGASLADDNLFDYITARIGEYGVAPGDFCFEITETTAISNLSRAMNFIKKLKNIGCTFALDDFGNGFSSFAYLKNLPFDYLKLDGSFVKGIDKDEIDLAMVEAVNKIGHILGMQTIAEFVKDSAIMERLKTIGVDYGQGYEIARPSPLNDMIFSGESTAR